MRLASFSGWGVRTVARTATRYNPISYHNGSVWPHDNALIALGFARYGLKEPVQRIFTGLFDAACHWDPRRLPELFCGFARRHTAPTMYPVACSPQAWASAAVFALIEASVGLNLYPATGEICFDRPVLPRFLTTSIFGDCGSARPAPTCCSTAHTVKSRRLLPPRWQHTRHGKPLTPDH